MPQLQLLNDGSDLAHLLIDEGVITAAAVVDGGIAIRDVSSRNRGAIVSVTGGARLFVKHGGSGGGEAERYRSLAAVPDLEPYVPRVTHWDAARGVLVTVAEDGGEDLWRHHLSEERFPVSLGAAVGRALGVLHSRVPAPAPGRHPPVLRLHRPEAGSLGDLTPASLDLIRTIQGEPGIGRTLDVLRREWRSSCLIHGDVKWPNVIAVPDPGVPDRWSVRLVDWEHSGGGDPAWDLGSALAAYVTFWLYSIAPPDDADPSELAAAARFPLSDMRPALGALWSEYLAASGITAGLRELRRRAGAHCAARLIQTAFEDTSVRERMRGRVALHLQVAANMLADPELAAVTLLGLTIDGR